MQAAKMHKTECQQSEAALSSAVLSCFRAFITLPGVGRFFLLHGPHGLCRERALEDRCLVSVNCPSGQTMVQCEAQTEGPKPEEF